MKFFTILATIFCGGTVMVAADFFIEFRAPATAPGTTSASSSRVQMIDFLFDCKGYPGARANTAAGSRCKQVTSPQDKQTIYRNCNFYKVFRPDLQGQTLRLPRGVMPTTYEWFLGYHNHDIDHPNFAEPTEADIETYRNRLALLSFDNAVPAYLVKGVAVYFAQNNLIAFSVNPTQANSHFLGFATLLKKIMEKHRNIHEETIQSRIETLRTQLDLAMNIVLEKMIDPCSVLLGNLQRFASGYCATYCDFLSFVSRRFNICANRCSSLQEGWCMGVVCNCNRVIIHPFAGCDNDPASPMQFCHNSLRLELNR